MIECALYDQYVNVVVPQLKAKRGYKNPMEIPKLVKIVINTGLGDIKDNAKSKDAANRSVEAATGAQLPIWMDFDKANLKATVLAVPTREQIAPIVDEQAIVELYSR